MNNLDLPRVSLIQRDDMSRYADTPPFDPGSLYPESPFRERVGPERNPAYEAVRENLHRLNYDPDHFGTPEWNPLGWLVRPGNTVFLKPNMIAHKHEHNDDWEYVITHGSIIRAVIDYVFIALQGRGRVIIGDAPQTDSHFNQIVERMGLREIQQLYSGKSGFKIDILDLRDEHWVQRDGIYVETVKLKGDPAGSISVDLAGNSAFAELDGRGNQYYGAYYDVDETNRHHRDGKHEYAISRSPILADVFINLPKLKTHKKCGITVNLKGLVGINANKNWLPHYVVGTPATGGDQFDSEHTSHHVENKFVLRAKRMLTRRNRTVQFFSRKVKALAYRLFGTNDTVVRSGNWHGNDTVWRMCIDLNRILMYSNSDGTMRKRGELKHFFSIVDGIVAMEGNGPVSGTPKPIGAVIAGSNPVAVDAVCAQLMGFEIAKLPLISRAFDEHPQPLIEHGPEDIRVTSNQLKWNAPLLEWDTADAFHFRPHFGWAGHIESEHHERAITAS